MIINLKNKEKIMKTIKKCISLVLIATVSINLSACNNTNPQTETALKSNIVKSGKTPEVVNVNSVQSELDKAKKENKADFSYLFIRYSCWGLYT
jgi:hypothetical protein